VLVLTGERVVLVLMILVMVVSKGIGLLASRCRRQGHLAVDG
jgi:hypothetical protein